MPFNRIAIYGHRGWVSSAVVAALIESGAPLKVLHRPDSDVSNLPETVTTVEVDLTDQNKVVDALKHVDIVISLIGHEGITQQHHLVTAISKSNVQLFVPSKLAANYDEQGLRIPLNSAKKEVAAAAREAGIPVTTVLLGNFAEFALGTLAMGVDYQNNRMIFTGDSANQPVNLCTRPYVAAAYASIFATTPIPSLQNRTLTLSELSPTGAQIAAALAQKQSSRTKTTTETLASVNQKIETGLQTGMPAVLAYYCRKIWGTGEQGGMLGGDVWDVEGYDKVDVEELVGGGLLGGYREMSPAVKELFGPQFEECQ